jgi:hypothetical protein
MAHTSNGIKTPRFLVSIGDIGGKVQWVEISGEECRLNMAFFRIQEESMKGCTMSRQSPAGGNRNSPSRQDDYLELVKRFSLHPFRTEGEYEAAAESLDKLVPRVKR